MVVFTSFWRPYSQLSMHNLIVINHVYHFCLFVAAPPTRPRAKPTSKVEDFVPEGDVDGFFESDEDEEEEDEDKGEDRYVWNALMCARIL